MWLLTNWKLVAYGAAILAIFGAGYWVSSQIAENKLKSALAEQETALHAQCDADKKLTNEASHGYQAKISNLDRQLANLKRLHAKTACVPVASPAGGHNDTAGAKPAGQNGITTDALFEYAGSAEKYRLQLESCQDFIRKVWER